MRLDALAATIAFVLSLSSLLAMYRMAQVTIYSGSYRCWADVEKAADDILQGRQPDADGAVKLIYVTRSGQEKIIGEPGQAMCYTYRILRNGTLVRIELRP